MKADTKHVTMAETVEAVPADKPKRRVAMSAAERQRAEKERAEANRLKRRAEMPAVLFGLMVRAKELESAGCDVMFDLYADLARAPREHVSVKQHGLPGVVFRFKTEYARAMGGDWRDYVEYEVLSVETESWAVEVLTKRFDELQEQADETKRQRALAAEAKALLTPEQLAALKQFG